MAVEWICFASSTYGAFVPLYTNVNCIPEYFSDVTLDASTENLYWATRLIGALADPYFGASIMNVDRYKNAVAAEGRRLILEYDKKMMKQGKYDLYEEANEKIAEMTKRETQKCLNNVLTSASNGMKNGYSRSDN